MTTFNFPVMAINPPSLIGKAIEVWGIGNGVKFKVEGIEYDHEFPEMVTITCSPLPQDGKSIGRLTK